MLDDRVPDHRAPRGQRAVEGQRRPSPSGEQRREREATYAGHAVPKPEAASVDIEVLEDAGLAEPIVHEVDRAIDGAFPPTKSKVRVAGQVIKMGLLPPLTEPWVPYASGVS